MLNIARLDNLLEKNKLQLFRAFELKYKYDIETAKATFKSNVISINKNLGIHPTRKVYIREIVEDKPSVMYGTTAILTIIPDGSVISIERFNFDSIYSRFNLISRDLKTHLMSVSIRKSLDKDKFNFTSETSLSDLIQFNMKDIICLLR